jgi:hypothetical protein
LKATWTRTYSFSWPSGLELFEIWGLSLFRFATLVLPESILDEEIKVSAEVIDSIEVNGVEDTEE